MFQRMLFARIVPNCAKLGVFDAGAAPGQPGWLRERLAELGIIGFENMVMNRTWRGGGP